ncbi:MAG TPA: hypothetical protein VF556_18670 [Pyrinomonadaceae bacterium]|jgi:hypothetical protein
MSLKPAINGAIFKHFLSSDEQLRKAAENCVNAFVKYFEGANTKTYQKQGYPLGKSQRGLKKWQTRRLERNKCLKKIFKLIA